MSPDFIKRISYHVVDHFLTRCGFIIYACLVDGGGGGGGCMEKKKKNEKEKTEWLVFFIDNC